jgi:uncharacterized protein YutE (UPF0331/DUF86 family)
VVDKPKLDQMLSNLRRYLGVLGPDARDGLAAMARLQNRLVHLYWDVENARVHECLRTSLGDLERFGQTVAAREW